MPRSAAPADLPSPGDPDRKRVLNVLAQRRYRQRRKEKYAQLERQAKSASSASSASAESSTSPESGSDQSYVDAQAIPSHSGISLLSFEEASLGMNALAPFTGTDLEPSMSTLFGSQALSNDVGFPNMLMSEEPRQPFELPQPQLDPGLSMDQVMEVPLLKLLTAAGVVAQNLGCQHLIWDPSSRWTIPSSHIPGLPSNMQPTSAQLRIPHHPLFDILPWPQLRTKLICVFALPQQQRPERAQSDDAFFQCAFDIEDERDGFRINGEGHDENDWEIGEAFFKNWWWALDRTIIETTNGWRKSRGQKLLSL